MALTRDDSFETTSGQYQFVRNSKLRQSIRIRDRPLNRKVPPAALIFMKSLEKNTKSIRDPVTSIPLVPKKVDKPSVKKTVSLDIMEMSDFDDFDESTQLIKRRSSKRSSIKGVQKASVKKHQKLNRLINFFL